MCSSSDLNIVINASKDHDASSAAAFFSWIFLGSFHGQLFSSK